MTHTFAFLMHPANQAQLEQWWPLSRLVPHGIRLAAVSSLCRDRIFEVGCERGGVSLKGYLIGSPLLPASFRPPHEESALRRVQEASRFAKGLGVQLIGLGGCGSWYAEFGEKVSRSCRMPVTNGNAFTAWTVMEAVYRAARAQVLPVERATVAVIGAGSAIGRLCAFQCANYAQRLLLWDTRASALSQLKADLEGAGGASVAIADDALTAVKQSEISLMLTDWAQSGVSVHEFPSQSIICDITLCDRAYRQERVRPDVTVVTAGLVKAPAECMLRMPCEEGARDVFPAALAETMVLAAEGRFVSYSLGERINTDKVEEIADLALRHGFHAWVPQLAHS